MAKTMLVGDAAQVELLSDPADEELVLARCVLHRPNVTAGIKCRWQDRYDSWADAINYAEPHADTGRE
jgi:hypothetical protein